MNNYNFETVPSRYAVNAPKWLEIKKYHPEEPAGIIPFSVADMEFEVAPEIREGLKKYIDTYIVGYANPTPAFQQAVVDWMKRHHNWDVKPEWMVYTNGVINAFYEAVKAFTKPGDGVLLMTPVYYPMYSAITVNGRKVVENKLINTGTRYEIDFEDLEKKAADPNVPMLIFCNPHNPGGRVWTREELEKVADICLRNNVLMVSDEIHFDLVRKDVKHTVLASLSKEVADHTLTFTAASKTFNLAGYTTSTAIISNPELKDRFYKELSNCMMHIRCNVLGHEATRLAYTEGDEWFAQCWDIIVDNYYTVKNFLAKEFPTVKVHDMEGTYLLWMDFRNLGIEPKLMAEALKKEGYLFFDDGFVFGEAGAGFERWNLACPKKYVEEGLVRLKNVLNKYRTDK